MPAAARSEGADALGLLFLAFVVVSYLRSRAKNQSPAAAAYNGTAGNTGTGTGTGTTSQEQMILNEVTGTDKQLGQRLSGQE